MKVLVRKGSIVSYCDCQISKPSWYPATHASHCVVPIGYGGAWRMREPLARLNRSRRAANTPALYSTERGSLSLLKAVSKRLSAVLTVFASIMVPIIQLIHIYSFADILSDYMPMCRNTYSNLEYLASVRWMDPEWKLFETGLSGSIGSNLLEVNIFIQGKGVPARLFRPSGTCVQTGSNRLNGPTKQNFIF